MHKIEALNRILWKLLFNPKTYFLLLALAVISSSSCDCRGPNEKKGPIDKVDTVVTEKKAPGLYFTFSGNNFTTEAVCDPSAYAPCHSFEYANFSYYDKFYDQYECNPNNPSDPTASGLFIFQHLSSGSDGYLSCNLPPPPGGDAKILDDFQKDKNKSLVTYFHKVKEMPPPCQFNQDRLSDYCVGISANLDTTRILYNKFFLSDKSKRPGCPTDGTFTNTFDFLKHHYECAINNYNSSNPPPSDLAKLLDTNICNKINGEVGDCFTLIHGDDELFTTIIRIPGNPDSVIRMTYNDESAMENVFF